MSNIHDNEIISYIVDLKSHKIIIHTIEYQDSSQTEVVFCDVLAHMFETQIEGSIIFDIQKYDLNHFMKKNRDLLERKKNYGWPMDYNTEEELRERLLKEHYQYYVVTSSYGLSGWVLAKEYEIISS